MQLRKELRQGFQKHSFKNDGSLNKWKKNTGEKRERFCCSLLIEFTSGVLGKYTAECHTLS